MSNQESSSVLTEPETVLGHAPTGTTHILTVVVDLMNKSVTVSDPSLRIRNGDTVIWRFSGLISGAITLLGVTFTGTVHPMVSTAAQVGTSADVKVDVSEEDGALELSQPYVLKVNGTSFQVLGLDPITTELVIDNMGGMMRKPPHKKW